MSRIMIIDTETANSVEQPLPYDVGYCIFDDETGETLVERSFVVAEIFFDSDLMKEAYFAEKVPQYFKDIRCGKRIVKGIFNIRKQLWADMKEYNCYKVGAYNMGFDNRATKNDIRYISSSFTRWFFPYKTEFFCIWHMACSSILNTRDYADFAINNNFVSESGNIQTSAEVVYKYLTNNMDFIESHTGLEDVKIERDIYMNVIKSGLPYKDTIYSCCWRMVQHWMKE